MNKFVTFEGMEGVGKSSVIRYINEKLKERSIKTVVTREPGGTKVADKLRDLVLSNHEESILPETELMLLLAARKQHIEHFIRPHLQKGYLVISDRFFDATYAYQCGGRGLSTSVLEKLNELLGLNFHPDFTFLLDAPINTCLDRLKNREKSDRFDTEDLEFFRKVKRSYLNRAKADPDRIVTINCDKDFEIICQTVLNKLLQKIAQ